MQSITEYAVCKRLKPSIAIKYNIKNKHPKFTKKFKTSQKMFDLSEIIGVQHERGQVDETANVGRDGGQLVVQTRLALRTEVQHLQLQQAEDSRRQVAQVLAAHLGLKPAMFYSS